MKYLFLLALIAAVVAGCEETDATSNTASTAEPGGSGKEEPTTIQWIDSVQNYGRITEGQQLEVSFRFRNTGNKPLIIKSVQPACGCTAAAPPDKPILPGEEGVINATFNSQGRIGTNSKDIMVKANTMGSEDHKLHFDVEVVKG